MFVLTVVKVDMCLVSFNGSVVLSLSCCARDMWRIAIFSLLYVVSSLFQYYGAWISLGGLFVYSVW